VSAQGADAGLSDLAQDRELLDRSSTAERVATILRDRLIEGFFQPGTRLSEESIGRALGVSRNTLREAFRLLAHERLVEHELNRGVFVRRLSPQDVVALFRARRIVECAALRELATASDEALRAVREAVEQGEAAAKEGRWTDAGTANMRFHQAIVGLTGSGYLEQFMRQAMAELRLVFHVARHPRELHEPYVCRNRELLEAVEARNASTAERLLTAYLADAQEQLLRAYQEAPQDAETPRG
jgi:DNA-binding GntR family transcriptional regulator